MIAMIADGEKKSKNFLTADHWREKTLELPKICAAYIDIAFYYLGLGYPIGRAQDTSYVFILLSTTLVALVLQLGAGPKYVLRIHSTSVKSQNESIACVFF